MTETPAPDTEANREIIRRAFAAWQDGTGFFADGATVIVVWDGRGIAHDGPPYENSYAWFMEMRDGTVVDATAFFDSIALHELWTRVQPQG
jgi:ketosteroid isomerase-like protein